MPARTNSFQKLILLLSERFGPARIIESAMIRDGAGDTMREVDITVVFEPGAGPVTHIVLECIDRSRPASIEWVEQMCKKHEDLKTPALILASARGFSKSARKKAETYDIGLIEPDAGGRWARAEVERVQNGSLFFVTLTVTQCVVVVLQNDAERRVIAKPEYIVHDETGAATCVLEQIVNRSLRNGAAGEQLTRGAIANREARYFELSLRPLPLSETRIATFDVQSQPAQTQELVSGRFGYLRNSTELEEIVDIIITGTVEHGHGHSADLKLAIIDGMRVAWGTATVADKKILIATVDDRLVRSPDEEPTPAR